MRSPLGPPEVLVVLLIVALLSIARHPRELATQIQQAIHRLRYYYPSSRPELRGLEWLALAVALLFLELIWLSRQY